MIAVVNYGVGNLGSVLNMLRRVGADACVTQDPDRIATADRLILPGVGAFDHAITRLRASGLIPHIESRVREHGVPLLGICLGMQLLTRGSEEGSQPGLGWIPADTVRFRFDGPTPPRLPHMGWGDVRVRRPDPLFAGLESDARFYFVHSYHVRCDVATHILAECDYGTTFTVAFGDGVVRGVQFHPERSHRFGMRLLANFAMPGA